MGEVSWTSRRLFWWSFEVNLPASQVDLPLWQNTGGSLLVLQTTKDWNNTKQKWTNNSFHNTQETSTLLKMFSSFLSQQVMLAKLLTLSWVSACWLHWNKWAHSLHQTYNPEVPGLSPAVTTYSIFVLIGFTSMDQLEKLYLHYWG